MRATLAKDRAVPRSSALVAFSFQNHCEEAAALDWRAVVVTGYETKDGAPVRLFPFAAHHLTAGRLDGMTEGHEAIRFDAPEDEDDDHDDDEDDRKRRRHKPRFVRVCVDYAAVAQDLAALAPVCLEGPGDPTVVDLERSGFRRALGATSPYGGTGPEFGSWSTLGWPRFTEGAGVAYQSWHLGGRTMRDARDEPVRVLGFGSGDAIRGASFDIRLGSYVAGPVYLGFEGSLGGGSAPSQIRYVAGDGAHVRLEGAGAVLVELGAHAGAAGRIGRLQPFAEVGVGISGVNLTGHDQLTARWTNVTPRAGLSWWFDPHVTIGAYAGVDVTDVRSQTFGITLAGHLRSFDGN